jgi:hypothetical protein
MSTSFRDDECRTEQEARIRAMKEEAARLAGGKVPAWESGALSPDARERFWREVLACETAPWTTNFQQLVEAGVELPEPEALADAALGAKLWEVIDRLAAIRVFLSDTDHLSDRELYTALWHEVLREETRAIGDDPAAAYHVSLVGTGSDEDNRAYLTYYADDADREHWRASFPGEELPPRKEPPFDRDRLLPQRSLPW